MISLENVWQLNACDRSLFISVTICPSLMTDSGDQLDWMEVHSTTTCVNPWNLEQKILRQGVCAIYAIMVQ